MDLWRVDRPDVTFRRLKVLVSQLRPGSRIAQAEMEDTAWTSVEYFLAALIDAVRENTWVNANHGVETSKQSAHPDPMDRPKDAREKRDHQRLQLKRARAFHSAHTPQ